jgi:type IV pilus assembly protein PilO
MDQEGVFMNFTEMANLDPKNIGSWPAVAKSVVIGLLCIAVLAGGYWFDTRNQITQLDLKKKAEVDLKRTLEEKQRKAANLEPLKNLLAEIEQALGGMLRLLPNKAEIENLLVDISQAGLGSGLEFDLFKPKPETPADFYATQPIDIKVNGSYEEFGKFVNEIAKLPRIVTLHNLRIEPRASKDKQELVMDLEAKIYRYLDETEIQAAGGQK